MRGEISLHPTRYHRDFHPAFAARLLQQGLTNCVELADRAGLDAVATELLKIKLLAARLTHARETGARS